ncbi:MAG: hypothetical protein ACLUNZ_02030 [Evtepia sp.]
MDGKPVSIRSPKDAFALRHRHDPPALQAGGCVLRRGEHRAGTEGRAASWTGRPSPSKIRDISSKYGFDLDPDKKIYDMAVSEKQTVEIIKVLYRGADILILDEPTAVLTPQETEKLFSVLRNMRADGKSIVIITHKLHEVMAISDRVAVLRKGQLYRRTVDTSQTSPQQLTDMMVGHAVTLNIDRPRTRGPQDLRLEVKDLTCPDGRGRQGPGRRVLRRQRRGDPGHCRHRRQRPEGTAARPSPGLYPVIPRCTIIYHHPPRRTQRRSGCACMGIELPGKIPGRSTTWACPWPLCRRTGWAWAWWAPWAWRTT